MNTQSKDSHSGKAESILAIDRPHPRLMTYYFVVSLIILPLFPIVILPHLFRYLTLRYRFDEEGVSMRWGILFRHEVSLQYARIQDIHLHSNLLERWLGLGRVLVQTASGSASAEMTIEGLLEFEQVRDFLYARMRGAKEKAPVSSPREGGSAITAVQSGELTLTLRSVAEEIRALREAIEQKRSS